MRRCLRWVLLALPCAASGQQPKGGIPTAPYRCGGAPLSAVAPLPDSITRPPAPLVAMPSAVRGLYVNRWAALGTRMWELIGLARTTEVNALVIDVKDDRGFVLYRSRVPLAHEIGADTNSVMRPERLRALLDSLRSHDIYPIARIVVVKDPLLASKKLEWSIKRRDAPSEPWLDKNGRPWLDAHQEGPWGYAADLACEAVELGFSEVQLDYVRFPDERRLIREAIFPLAQGRPRAQVIHDQLALLRERLRPLGVPVAADIFGLVTSDTTDMGIGQRLEQMATVVDVVLPMMYPSHYAPGSYGFSNPNAHPYQVIDHGLKDAQRRMARTPGAGRLVPWYQAFTLGAPHYDDAAVRAQMKAGYDNGVMGWMLWNPGSRYGAGSLAPKAPSPR